MKSTLNLQSSQVVSEILASPADASYQQRQGWTRWQQKYCHYFFWKTANKKRERLSATKQFSEGGLNVLKRKWLVATVVISPDRERDLNWGRFEARILSWTSMCPLQQVLHLLCTLHCFDIMKTSLSAQSFWLERISTSFQNHTRKLRVSIYIRIYFEKNEFGKIYNGVWAEL